MDIQARRTIVNNGERTRRSLTCLTNNSLLTGAMHKKRHKLLQRHNTPQPPQTAGISSTTRLNTTPGNKSSSTKPSSPHHHQEASKNPPKQKEEHLKWTEREKAPKWLRKMAPTRGGTKPPNKIEAAVISVVAILGYYSWFVDPGSFLVDDATDDSTSNVNAEANANEE